MNEKIIIKNFASIRDAELALENINILIGPQATGKSLSAKSLYYFKSFASDLFSSVENELTKREFDRKYLQKFEEYFPIQSLGTTDFLLRHEVGNLYVQIERKDSKLKLDYSKFYVKELTSTRQQMRKNIDKYVSEEDVDRYRAIRDTRRHFYDSLKNELKRDVVYGQLFIPAGRSFFAILQSSIFSFLSSNKAVDPFLTEFGSFYENIKRLPSDIIDDFVLRGEKAKDVRDLRKLKEKIDFIVEEVLSGKYIQERGKDFLISNDGRRTSLDNSSSGQQEMLPLSIILGTIPFISFLGGNGNTVYIEEPEAHLFPTAQKRIVELIAIIYNLSKIPNQFFITTHSPYLLASFNNLIQSGNLANNFSPKQKTKLKKIVPEEQWLNSDQVNVYSVYDGQFECIKSKETGLISTNILDFVSNEIGAQFDNMLDIS